MEKGEEEGTDDEVVEVVVDERGALAELAVPNDEGVRLDKVPVDV